jgi:hypothetical protein
MLSVAFFNVRVSFIMPSIVKLGVVMVNVVMLSVVVPQLLLYRNITITAVKVL